MEKWQIHDRQIEKRRNKSPLRLQRTKKLAQDAYYILLMLGIQSPEGILKIHPTHICTPEHTRLHPLTAVHSHTQRCTAANTCTYTHIPAHTHDHPHTFVSFESFVPRQSFKKISEERRRRKEKVGVRIRSINQRIKNGLFHPFILNSSIMNL